MTKHTPGPWHIANGVQIRSERHQIAKVWMMRNGEGNANARLIASAPDLLEALKQTEFALARCFGPYKEQEGDRHRALDKARAAIAKAEGEKQ